MPILVRYEATLEDGRVVNGKHTSDDWNKARPRELKSEQDDYSDGEMNRWLCDADKSRDARLEQEHGSRVVCVRLITEHQ